MSEHTPDAEQLRDEYEERAGIMEYCGEIERREAEMLAAIEVYGTAVKPGGRGE